MSDTYTSEAATTIVSGEIFIRVTPYIFLREHATAMHKKPIIYEYLNESVIIMYKIYRYPNRCY